MRDRIQGWLTDIGCMVGMPADDNSQFHLSASMPSQAVLDIIQPNGRNDQIVIAGGYQLTPEQSRRMREINERKRDEFLWDLQFSFVLGHFSFDFEPATGLPERVLVSEALWYDGITKHSFMKGLEHVNAGLTLAIWKLGKELGGLATSNQRGPTYSG